MKHALQFRTYLIRIKNAETAAMHAVVYPGNTSQCCFNLPRYKYVGFFLMRHSNTCLQVQSVQFFGARGLLRWRLTLRLPAV